MSVRHIHSPVRQSGEDPISVDQRRILVALVDAGGTINSLDSLAYAGIRKSVIRSAIKGLERHGYVSTHPIPDSCHRKVRMTGDGSRRADRILDDMARIGEAWPS